LESLWQWKRRTVAVFAAGLLLCTGADAQQSNPNAVNRPEPFKLSVEKRQQQQNPKAPPMSLRISRDRLNLNAGVEPPLAPPRYQARQGAQVDANDFALRATGGMLQGRATDGSLQGRAAQMAPLTGSVFVKSLANYDVELIVDESLSMRKRDCPGGVSRWDWCGMQLRDLSAQLSPYVPRGFTLTTFNSQFQSYPNARPEHVQELFEYPQFSWGTRLSRPLNARLNAYFNHRTAKSKPLLVVVITDGVPAPREEPELVAQALISASNRVQRAGEATVVFFQIGGADQRGRWFLNEMDNSLVASGARHDIVRTISFEQLQSQGLTRCLVDSVRNQVY
jgi:hypothetical protein